LKSYPEQTHERETAFQSFSRLFLSCGRKQVEFTTKPCQYRTGVLPA
jgi:hypothetical protein